METSMDLNLSCATLNNACSGSVDPTVQIQTPVPEPGSLSLLGAGLITLGVKLRSRKISRLRETAQ
jgi:PEP-CTERM motif